MIVLIVLFLVEKIKRYKRYFRVNESAFSPRMKNLHTKKTSNRSKFGWLIFLRPFLRSLFLEGPIYGGKFAAYLWREICVSKSSGLALQLEGNLLFLLCFTLYLRAISEYKSPGGLYMERRFNRQFFALQGWGAYIWRGVYMEGLIFRILRYIKNYVKANKKRCVLT